MNKLGKLLSWKPVIQDQHYHYSVTVTLENGELHYREFCSTRNAQAFKEFARQMGLETKLERTCCSCSLSDEERRLCS